MPVDSVIGPREHGSALKRGAKTLMRPEVSFLETGHLFFCDQDGHAPRGGSAHAKQSVVRVIVAPADTTKERMDAYQGNSKVV